MKKKHLLLSIILLCILFSLTACGRQNSGNSSTSDGNTQLSGKHHVAIEVNNYGTIEVELDADTAPITVTNFINLANSGFYNGLTFHRVIDGFRVETLMVTELVALLRKSRVNSSQMASKII